MKISQEYSMTGELKLLILCSMGNLLAQEEIIKELLLDPINWDVFYKLAVKHKVYPVVYKNLMKVKDDSLVLEVIPKLENISKKMQLENFLLTAELVKLMELLKGKEIRAISLKGPLLSLDIYQDFALRPSRDLDILVDNKRLDEIHKILIDWGYALEESIANLTPKQMELYKKTSHHISYISDQGILIELHHRLSNGYDSRSFEEIWEMTRECKIFGKSYRVLREEDNFLYLVFHGSKHGFKRLRWLCDIYEILKAKPLDWEYIVHQGNQLGICHLIAQTIILIRRLFPFKLGRKITMKKEDVLLGKALADLVPQFLLTLDEKAECFGHPLFFQYSQYMWLWNQGVIRKGKYVLEYIRPNPQDFQWLKLSDKIFCLYYLLHPLRLMKKASIPIEKECKKFINYIKLYRMNKA